MTVKSTSCSSLFPDTCRIAYAMTMDPKGAVMKARASFAYSSLSIICVLLAASDPARAAKTREPGARGTALRPMKPNEKRVMTRAVESPIASIVYTEKSSYMPAFSSLALRISGERDMIAASRTARATNTSAEVPEMISVPARRKPPQFSPNAIAAKTIQPVTAKRM